MADNIKYRFIQNVGDYFPSGYFTDDFTDKVQKSAGVSSEEMKNLCSPYKSLRTKYEEYKNFIINNKPRTQDAIKRTHDWHNTLLNILGYDISHPYEEPYVVNQKDGFAEIIPVRHILRSGSNVSMLIMEMQHLISVGDSQPAGLFEQQYDDGNITPHQRYSVAQWKGVFPDEYQDKNRYRISPAIINKAITQIFLMPEERRPHFILMLAGNTVFLFNQDKWARGSYLQFSLDDLYAQAQVPAFQLHFALFHLLVCKNTLSSDGQTVLMDSLIEESYRNAYEVTKDLKEGVILAVETLANEALHYMKNVANRPFGKKKTNEDGTIWYDKTDDDFENEVKDDCITIVYRLLFILFAESRPELEILPMGDEVYKRGYSFEALRDLEHVHLNSQESRDGYFFDDSIHHLFRLLSSGYQQADNISFSVRPIDSPMFKDDRLKQLQGVKIRNEKWQEIIRALSLSHGKNYAGRISYANLGVNQLGSVYESLLAFRGFFTEEEYIEVHKAGDPSSGTFLVPYSRMDDFNIDEVLTDPENGAPKILKKDTFVYRLNGRDRQKSASYYTPEVLTKSTVKYTIKQIVDDVRDGKRKLADLLDLKILEPAVGAAAFLNEVINQLAEAYMTYVPKKPSPDNFRNELQKVKAYIATHNVYGVDLNPTAIELGKLSLWLNVIHKDMETPFFANRLTLGNAVIGAWLKVYNRNDVVENKNWWEKAPHKVKFFRNRVNRSVNDVYHFLLPDRNMLGVLNIDEQKKAHPAEKKYMDDKLKNNLTKSVSSRDFPTLQRLSAKIDVLLYEALQTQLSIERYTNNKKDIWPHEQDTQLDAFRNFQEQQNFSEKERIFDSRNRHDNAYYRLRLVMDYWCALWFWEYEDAAALPTREEYWQEIENLLDVSDDKLDANTRRAMNSASGLLSDDTDFEDSATLRLTEEEADIVEKSKEELLLGIKSGLTLFPEEEPERFKIVKRLSQRYHFFHPMLEFIEVFWLRGGFDIILGNPPWIKWEFEIQNIIGEKFPEVLIREDSATDVFFSLNKYLEDENTRQLCITEQTESECCANFMKARCNYPLLNGQQTDLYKSILTNSFNLINDQGYMGMVLPESMYTEPSGQDLRRYLYKHLQYHFQYQNALMLFPINSRQKFSTNVFKGNGENISFDSINNLFHPSTVDACIAHDGHGVCGGIKNEEGKWNLSGHKNRIIHYNEHFIRLLSSVFEDGKADDCAKLGSVHDKSILHILDKLENYNSKIASVNPLISECLHETDAPKDRTIKDIKGQTKYPDMDKYEMIYNAPHFYVANPIYRNPKKKSFQKSDYNSIDLTKISDDYIQKTRYLPLAEDYISLPRFNGFVEGQDENGNTKYGNWLDYYKVGFRKMSNPANERSLICAILPPKTAHINGVISTVFRRGNDTVDMAALCASLVMEFYWKIISTQNLTTGRIETFPHGFEAKYQVPMRARALRLNCLTNNYADLWDECWREEYKQEKWSLTDQRLSPWNELTPQWQHSTPLRNYFERRMALIEIDVIATMALGLSLKDLEMMYNTQFPVLQQNENDTWYDANGNIVFTCSKGLTGVGLSRPQWKAMRGNLSPDNMTYDGTTPTYLHTIDPQKSELYANQQVTYVAPYNRMNRIDDYRRAWAHFEQIFKH